MGIGPNVVSRQLAGAVMAVTAPLSLPALPTVSEWAGGLGFAENAVGALLLFVVAARFLTGLLLWVRDRDAADRGPGRGAATHRAQRTAAGYGPFRGTMRAAAPTR
ncbi:hypothetical protein [Halobaculum sp. D14]|uniref:hypothetical protein n=1 Tax=unclassified Halobaculum TaxID=2640896 RepID=UPI003EBC3721